MRIIDRFFVKKPRFRKFLTTVLYGNNNLKITFFGTSLFINSVKENGYLRAWNYAKKSTVFRDEVSVLVNLSSLITDNTTFVDIGANVGLFSSTMERFKNLFPSLRIFAFEANPDTFSRLTKTVEGTIIQVFNIAISNKETELEFVEGAVSGVFAEKSSSNSYHYKNSKIIKVKAKRLDQLSIPGKKLFLKIDVEGHEYAVLEGAKELFETNKIKVVYIDGYKNPEKVIFFLTKYGFRFLDGRTLKPIGENNYSLLALQPD